MRDAVGRRQNISFLRITTLGSALIGGGGKGFRAAACNISSDINTVRRCYGK